MAAVAVLLSVASVAYLVGRGNTPTPTVASMGNAGNAPATGTVRAPDISSMTPRQQFDRLYERIMIAAQNQAGDTVMLFAPMALSAYQQLDQIDADARYHAAMIHAIVGETAPALAKADSILLDQPGHLFAFVIRGEVAEQLNDGDQLAKAYSDFLAAYDAEIGANRKEYLEHRPVLDDFRNRAMANRR